MELGKPVSDLHAARQGDVVALTWVPTTEQGAPSQLRTPSGVVILSQTCDVVRDPGTRPHVLVAPIAGSLAKKQESDARRGRTPLLLHLPLTDNAEEKFADLQHATSVPKSSLLGTTLLSRHTTSDSAPDAAHLGARIGRAFSRFAFPDEIHGVTDALAKKARETSGSSKPFGRVIDYVEDLRVKASHWGAPGRVLTFYVIVSSALLIEPDDVDPQWHWGRAVIHGARPNEDIAAAPLARVSEILANACDAYIQDSSTADMTTLFYLWGAWAATTHRELLDPRLGAEVSEIRLVLESDDEFSLAQMRRTASLDLEDLSGSYGAISS